MVMSESYYHDDNIEPLYRSPNRPIATTAYYSRRGPYDYSHQYEHRRHHTRQPYAEQQTVEDGEPNNQGEQARRRIAVACSRCRKRKIKCTGDPGDGSGCGACKSVGPSLAQDCTFIRVKSEPIPTAQLEMLTQGVYAGFAEAPNFYERDGREIERRQKPRRHIPVLHTRFAHGPELDSPAHNSPIDAYPYPSSASGRQDSLSTAYSTESVRPWSTTCPAVPPPTPTYCDTYPTWTYASMPGPAPQQFYRLPSVSAESLSALNMGNLHSSLPPHGVPDRRLPVPYISQLPPAPLSHPESTRVRPLGSFSTPRLPVNAAHSRHAVPWMLDTSATRAGSTSTYSNPIGLLSTSSQPMPAITGSAYSNQFSTASYGNYRGSPDISPTSAHPQSTTFDSSSSSSANGDIMQPHQMASRHYYPTASTQQEMPSHTTTERPSSSYQRGMQNIPGLYGYGAAPSDQQSTLQEQENSIISSSGVTTYPIPVRHGRHSIDGEGSSYLDDSNTGYQTVLQHPRPLPQHSASIDNLCRQSPFEQQTPRSSTASRMSISNFSGGYQ